MILAELILDEIREVTNRVDKGQFTAFLEQLVPGRRVFAIGVGRVLLSLQAFVKRLNHFGIHASSVGDLGEPPLRPNDLLLVGSGSGATRIPLAIAARARELGAVVVHLGAVADSPMTEYSDLFVRIPTKEVGLVSAQPMTSLFEQSLYVILDAACLAIWQRLDRRERAYVESNHANLE